MACPEPQHIDTETLFQALLESAPDAIVIVDESGEMRFRVLGPLRRQVLDDLVDEVLGGRATP